MQSRSKAVEFFDRFSFIILPSGMILALFLALYVFGQVYDTELQGGVFSKVTLGILLSISRLGIAYSLALCVSMPIAVFISGSSKLSRLSMPIYDALQSIPFLIFLPIIVLFFVQSGFVQGATIVILFLGMLWILMFNLITGLKAIPEEVTFVGQVFDAHGLKLFRSILLPGVMPYLVTGSNLAWSAGWNFTIMAEVIKAYLPSSHQVQDVLGIGSVLINAGVEGDYYTLFTALFVMIVTVIFMNYFVWRKLLHYAEQYRF